MPRLQFGLAHAGSTEYKSMVLLQQLYWLPVEFRIRCKLACLTISLDGLARKHLPLNTPMHNYNSQNNCLDSFNVIYFSSLGVWKMWCENINGTGIFN